MSLISTERTSHGWTVAASHQKALWLTMWVVGAAMVYVLPAWLGGSPLVYGTFVTIAIFSVMTYGVDLVLSYLGEVSLGHTIFWAIGGYSAAILSTSFDANGWQTAAVSVALSLVAACLLGWATLKMQEFVFSLVTYAAAVVAAEVTFNTDALGGSDGFVGIPQLELPFGFATFHGQSSAQLWPVAFGLLLATVLLVLRFRSSRLGLSALMVQMNEPLARASGLSISRVRLKVFVLSAPITALAGWLYAYQRAYVGPDMFETYFLVVMLTAIIVVGRRVLFGPIIGVSLILAQQNFFSIGGDGNKVALGVVLVGILVGWPKGLVGQVEFVRHRRAARRGESV
jgi:branched-chain amino acid transport system permease protein